MSVAQPRASLRFVAAVLLAIGLMVTASAAPASAVGGTPIDSAGPLTQILVGDDSQCQVFHAGDTDPEFYGDVDDGACGTFVAVGGVLYGPDSVPAGGDAEPRTPFTPVSQSAVSGDGSATSPFSVTTVMDLGASGLQLTEVDTYVIGQEAYKTGVTVANTTGEAVSAVIYRAGDCYLQNSDDGYGQVDGNAVSCRSPENERIEQWFPITAGSTYMEGYYDDVWAHIGSQAPFANTCMCDQTPGNEHDNGAGLSWVRPIAAGATTTVEHYTTFAPLGIQTPTVTKTADIAEVAPGATDGYTITISNPAVADITLETVSDTLPAGFTYTVGTTTGATTTDPVVADQIITWNGPFTVPANGSTSLHFSVTVSSVPGTYTNSATATGPGLAIIGAVDVAPVVVVEPPPPTTVPAPVPVAVAVVARPVFTG